MADKYAQPVSHTDILDHEAHDRGDDEQITVFEPDENNAVHLWCENDDGECSVTLYPDERRRLAARLMAGLE